MSYSTNKITSIADCDLLISMAAKDKANLDFKILSDERQKILYSDNSVEIDADLQATLAELAATETIINTLPDGPTREDAGKRKIKLEYRQFLLEERKESHGTVALLEKELDLARLALELSEVNTFIAEVTAKKATF